MPTATEGVTPEASDRLMKLANGAGYFFQERLREEISQTYAHHKWKVTAEEHRWCNGNGSEGFIDLVLEHGDYRMVIEAKRTKDAEWVFLVPEGAKRSQEKIRCLWTRRRAGEPTHSAWGDVEMYPSSPEAKFCVIRGQGDRDQPMLERLGGILLHSTESLAEEELQLGTPAPHADPRLYLPVIVTNAQMYACFYDPKKVDLRTGELPDGDFEPIHFIRFRKGLATGIPVPAETASLEKANRAKERTILIVEGARIGEVLSRLEMA